jgi:malate dehydrogenase
LLQGEYGLTDLFVGVPIRLGAGGVQEIIELNLTDDEQAALRGSAEAVQALVDAMARLASEAGT